MGNYRHVAVHEHSLEPRTSHVFNTHLALPNIVKDHIADNVCNCILHVFHQKYRWTGHKAPDFERLRPFFAYASKELIEKTFKVTTQWGRSVRHETYRKHFKSRFPALNIPRRNEGVATDTFYSDVPAIFGGYVSAQIFVGHKSLVTDVYGMKSDSQFVLTLEDVIRKRGAMDRLLSDRAQTLISGKVKDILRSLIIGEWQSEPYHEHQNPAERRYQTVKHYVNITMDRTLSLIHI